MKKRLFAILMCLCLLAGLFPLAALAAGNDASGDWTPIHMPSNEKDTNSTYYQLETVSNVSDLLATDIRSDKGLLEVPTEKLTFSHGIITGIDKTWLAATKDSSLAVTIPAEIYGSAVTGIGANAFKGANVATPAIVTTVDFSNAVNLTTIGSSAFQYSKSLTSVDLSATKVTTIDKMAFHSCTSLQEIILPDTLTNLGLVSSGGSVFTDCQSLRSIRTAASEENTVFALPKNLTYIGSQTFQNCFAAGVDAKVVIPTGVTTIGSQAFNDKQLSQIIVNKKGDSWDTNPYLGYDLKAFAFPSGCNRIIVFPDNKSFVAYSTKSGLASATKNACAYPITITFSSEGTETHLNHALLGWQRNESSEFWELDEAYRLPPAAGSEPNDAPAGYEYIGGWMLNGKVLSESVKLAALNNPSATATISYKLQLMNPQISYLVDDESSNDNSLTVTIGDGNAHTAGVQVTHPLLRSEEGPDDVYVYFQYCWWDEAVQGTGGETTVNGPRSEVEPELFSTASDDRTLNRVMVEQNTIPIASADHARTGRSQYLVEIFGYIVEDGASPTLFYKSAENFIHFGSGQTGNTVDDVYTLQVSVEEVCIVTYNANGGDTEADPNTQTVKIGSSVGTLPEEPTRGGFNFTGWNTAQEGDGTEFTEDTSVTEDITVYAQWEKTITPIEPEVAAYRVEHYRQQTDGNHTIVEENTEFPLYGEIGKTVIAIPKGYAHYHVNEDKSILSGTVTMPTIFEGELQVLTLKVYYDLDSTYQVSYDANGGSGTMTVDNAYFVNDEVTVLANAFTRNGYTFTGWNTQANGTGTVYNAGDTFVMLAADVTLFAQWKSNGGGGGGTTYYTLRYESNGGTEYKDERYASGTTVKLDKTPTREGYRFTGWYADKELNEHITSIKMTGGKTVYAGWRATTVPDMLNGDDHFAYVAGYTDGTVRPLNNITRAEVATIFFRLLKDDVRKDKLATTNTFKDVPDKMWCNTFISTMAELGVVSGRSAECFDPSAPITRAEFATICARFDTGPVKGDSSFTDIANCWARADIERATSLGWIAGYTDGTFRPDNYITRAEAMTMINWVLCRIPEDESDLLDGMKVWPDNDPGAWFYLAVQEATNSHNFERKGDIHEYWTELTATPDWTRYQD